MTPREPRKIYKCYAKDCMAKFNNLGARIIHVNVDHGGQILCPYENCNAYLKSSSISYHIMLNHQRKTDEGGDICQRCGRCVVKHDFLKHVLGTCVAELVEVKAETSYSMENDQFSMSDNLENTYEDLDSEPAKMKLKPRKSSRKSRRSKRDRREVTCWVENCERKVSNLSRHIAEVHNKMRKACKKCGKEFCPSNLKTHQNKCKGLLRQLRT